MMNLLESDLNAIREILKSELGQTDITNIRRLGGMTNHTYAVSIAGEEIYVVRLPGDGTETLINRRNEEISTKLAFKLDIDTKLLYFDKNGIKITRYIDDAMTMSAESLREEENIALAAKIFKKLHSCDVDTGVPFEVFDMATGYENIIMEHNIPLYDDYKSIKQFVFEIKNMIDAKEAVKFAPCHNDPLCENRVRSNERMYLIDWEYAGMNDPMWDLADLSIEAAYEEDEDEILLKEYFGTDVISEKVRERFIANKIYIDFLYSLWGKTRVPYDGAVMEEYALGRYERLRRNVDKFKGI